MAALADSEMIVGDGTTDPVAESGATLRTSIGVGTGDSPTFTALTLSDGQLVFPGTQVVAAGANTLDDYEEGTWTPAIADDTLDGSGEGQGYSTQNGRYTKIGHKVFFTLQLTTSSLGTLTGTQGARIVGLPFTHVNVAGANSSIQSGFGNGLNITANQNIGGFIVPNQTNITLYLWDVATGASIMSLDEWSANGQAMIAGHYEVED